MAEESHAEESYMHKTAITTLRIVLPLSWWLLSLRSYSNQTPLSRSILWDNEGPTSFVKIDGNNNNKKKELYPPAGYSALPMGLAITWAPILLDTREIGIEEKTTK